MHCEQAGKRGSPSPSYGHKVLFQIRLLSPKIPREGGKQSKDEEIRPRRRSPAVAEREMPPAGLPCVFPPMKKHAVARRKMFPFNGVGRIAPHHGAKPPNWQGSLVRVFPLFPSRFWDPRPGLSLPLPGQRPAFLLGIGVHRGSSLAALRRLGPNRCRTTSPSPAPLPCASLGRGNPGWEAPACVSAAPFSPPMQIPEPAPAPAQRSPSVCLMNFTVTLEQPRLRLSAGVRRRVGPVGEFSWILLRDFGCPSSGTGFSRHEVDSALWMRNARELPCLLQKPPRGKKKLF